MLGVSHEEKENTGTNINSVWSQPNSDGNKESYDCRWCEEKFSNRFHLQQHLLADHNSGVLLPKVAGTKRQLSLENIEDGNQNAKKPLLQPAVALDQSTVFQKPDKLDVNSNKPDLTALNLEPSSAREQIGTTPSRLGDSKGSVAPHLQLAASMTQNLNSVLSQKYYTPDVKHDPDVRPPGGVEGRSPMVSLLKAFQNHPLTSPHQKVDARSPYVSSPLGSDGNLTDSESRDDNSSVSSMGGNSGSFSVGDFTERPPISVGKPKKVRRSSLDDSQVKEIYKCTLCNKEFRQSGNFHNHMKTHTEVDKFCRCGICGVDFDSSDSLQVHMRAKHTGANPYKCEHCDRQFSQYNNLRRHLRVHREKIFKCNLCDREFNEEFYLTMHMGTHTGHRVYSCGVCNACFQSNHDLKTHVKTHSPSELHVCDVCGKAFSKACVLRQHKKAHSGERPYKCDRCSKTFIHRHHLTMHMRSHTDNKPFNCEICGKEFTQSSHLYKHIKQHEEGTLDTPTVDSKENLPSDIPAVPGTPGRTSPLPTERAGATPSSAKAKPPVKRRRRSKANVNKAPTPQEMPSNFPPGPAPPFAMFPPHPPPGFGSPLPYGGAPGTGAAGYEQFYRAYMAQAQAQAYYNNLYMMQYMSQGAPPSGYPGLNVVPPVSNLSQLPKDFNNKENRPKETEQEDRMGTRPQEMEGVQDLSVKPKPMEGVAKEALNLSHEGNQFLKNRLSSGSLKESPFMPTKDFYSMHNAVNLSQTHSSQYHIPHHDFHQAHKDIPRVLPSVHNIPHSQKSVHPSDIPNHVRVQSSNIPSHSPCVQRYDIPVHSQNSLSNVSTEGSKGQSVDLSSKPSQTGSRESADNSVYNGVKSVNKSSEKSLWNPFIMDSSHKKESDDSSVTQNRERMHQEIYPVTDKLTRSLGVTKGLPLYTPERFHGYQDMCLGNSYHREDEEIQDLSRNTADHPHGSPAADSVGPEDLSGKSSRQSTPTDLSVSREGTPTLQYSGDHQPPIEYGLLRPVSSMGESTQDDVTPSTVTDTEAVRVDEYGRETDHMAKFNIKTEVMNPDMSLSQYSRMRKEDHQVTGDSPTEPEDIKKLRKKIEKVKNMIKKEARDKNKEAVSTATNEEERKEEQFQCEPEAEVDDDDELAERRLQIVTEDSEDTSQFGRGCVSPVLELEKSHQNETSAAAMERTAVESDEETSPVLETSESEVDSQTLLPYQCECCKLFVASEAALSDHVMSSFPCFKTMCGMCGLVGISDDYGRQLQEMYQASMQALNDIPSPRTPPPDPCQPTAEPPQTAEEVENQSRLSCGICWKSFPTSGDLEKHQMDHVIQANTSNMCHKCDKKFSRPFDLQCHLMKHHKKSDSGQIKTSPLPSPSAQPVQRSPSGEKEERYSCDVCGETFDQEKFYKDHLGTHTGDRPYRCSECGRGFSYKHNLNRHMMSHSAKSFHCEVCGRSFKETFYLHMHMKIHAEEKNRRCEICGQHVPKSDLWQHMAKHLGTSEKNPTYEQIGERVKEILKEQTQSELNNSPLGQVNEQLQVQPNSFQNNLEQFSTIVSLAEQGKLPGGLGRPFPGEGQSLDLTVRKPGAQTSQGREAGKLQALGMGTEEVENIEKLTAKVRDAGNHTCHICNQVFKTKREFGNHLGIHNGERTHICRECGKGFKKSCILRQHEKIHSGKRPYKCEVCAATFLHYHHLQIHSRVHNGDRPYKCHICGMGFKHSSNMPKHLKTHELEDQNQSTAEETGNKLEDQSVTAGAQLDSPSVDSEACTYDNAGIQLHSSQDSAGFQPAIPEFPGKAFSHGVEIVNSA